MLVEGLHYRKQGSKLSPPELTSVADLERVLPDVFVCVHVNTWVHSFMALWLVVTTTGTFSTYP